MGLLRWHSKPSHFQTPQHDHRCSSLDSHLNPSNLPNLFRLSDLQCPSRALQPLADRFSPFPGSFSFYLPDFLLPSIVPLWKRGGEGRCAFGVSFLGRNPKLTVNYICPATEIGFSRAREGPFLVCGTRRHVASHDEEETSNALGPRHGAVSVTDRRTSTAKAEKTRAMRTAARPLSPREGLGTMTPCRRSLIRFPRDL